MSLLLIPNFRKPNRKILQNPDLRLKRMSESVKTLDSETRKIAESLIQILNEVDKPYLFWLGMAAPQLGFNKRIIAIRMAYHKYLIMINPKILDKKWFLPSLSGCYSLKGLYLVRAPYWTKVKYQDLKGKSHAQIFVGGRSVLLDQEVKHLDGELIGNV